MIRTEDLSYSYKREDDEGKEYLAPEVLNGVNIKIEKGSFVAILGHNGSGKSTLAKHFNAILLPTGGKVYVDNMDTANDDFTFEIRKNAGMVFQNPDNQMVAAVVEDEIAFAPENLGVEPKEIRKRVDDALMTVGMSKFANVSPANLSGGQKQRIAIAAVLAMKPQCIILDEATAMLDPMGRREVMDTIKKLNRENKMTVILITHYMDEAAEADRVIVMSKGKVMLDEAPAGVFSKVELMQELGLDVPQVTLLVHQLRKEGIELSEDIIDIDKCVSELLNYLTQGREK